MSERHISELANFPPWVLRGFAMVLAIPAGAVLGSLIGFFWLGMIPALALLVAGILPNQPDIAKPFVLYGAQAGMLIGIIAAPVFVWLKFMSPPHDRHHARARGEGGCGP